MTDRLVYVKMDSHSIQIMFVNKFVEMDKFFSQSVMMATLFQEMVAVQLAFSKLVQALLVTRVSYQPFAKVKFS